MVMCRSPMASAAEVLRAAGHRVRYECKVSMTYLLSDLGNVGGVNDKGWSPNRRRLRRYRRCYASAPGAIAIHFWAGYFTDIFERYGLTMRGTVETYNRQAAALSLPSLCNDMAYDMLPFGHSPTPLPELHGRAIFVENGGTSSGQRVVDVTPWLPRLGEQFPQLTFCCTSSPPPASPVNVLGCSALNVIQLSRLSNACEAQIIKLGGMSCAALTAENRGKRRLVVGWPMPYPFWTDDGFVYGLVEYDLLATALDEITGDHA